MRRGHLQRQQLTNELRGLVRRHEPQDHLDKRVGARPDLRALCGKPSRQALALIDYKRRYALEGVAQLECRFEPQSVAGDGVRQCACLDHARQAARLIAQLFQGGQEQQNQFHLIGMLRQPLLERFTCFEIHLLLKHELHQVDKSLRTGLLMRGGDHEHPHPVTLIQGQQDLGKFPQNIQSLRRGRYGALK